MTSISPKIKNEVEEKKVETINQTTACNTYLFIFLNFSISSHQIAFECVFKYAYVFCVFITK